MLLVKFKTMYDEFAMLSNSKNSSERTVTPDHLVKKAKDSRNWIYRRSTAQWYTPEEFTKIFFGMRVKNPDRFFKDFYIQDPIVGLRLKEKELQFFARKIAVYFDPVIVEDSAQD